LRPALSDSLPLSTLFEYYLIFQTLLIYIIP
jgi:hypothetical protein